MNSGIYRSCHGSSMEVSTSRKQQRAFSVEVRRCWVLIVRLLVPFSMSSRTYADSNYTGVDKHSEIEIVANRVGSVRYGRVVKV